MPPRGVRHQPVHWPRTAGYRKRDSCSPAGHKRPYRRIADQQQPLRIAPRGHAARHQFALFQFRIGFERAEIGAGGRAAALLAGQGIGAEDGAVAMRLAVKPGGLAPEVEQHGGIGRLGKAQPAQDAALLPGAGAGREAEMRQIVFERNRPANRIDRRDPPGERRARHAIVQQPDHMARALAVPGEDDRGILRRFGEKLVERLRHIAICSIERLLPGGLLGQERAESGLPITRGPNLPAPGERAGHGPDEQPRAFLRFGIVHRRVPCRRAQIAGRVDEEHGGRRIARGGGLLRARWLPTGRIVRAHGGGGEPHRLVPIGVRGQRRLFGECGAGHEGKARQFR